jgi:hypothetical protein
MPATIIAGLPLDIDRRVQSALGRTTGFAIGWELTWVRAKGRTPGIAPSQVEEMRQKATSHNHGAHLLIFRNESREGYQVIDSEIVPYFRVRWLSHAILRHIPHQMNDFLFALSSILDEELEWVDRVKP